MDAQDKSTSLTVCFFCIKPKYHQLQKKQKRKKNSDLPRSMRAGVRSSGFTESVRGSITKTAFQRLGGSMRSFSFRDLNKTRLQHRQPCRHLWLWGPKRLKDVSSLCTSAIVRACWKQPCLSDSTHWNTRRRVGRMERQRQQCTFRIWPNNRLRCGGRVPYVRWSHWHTLNLHAVAYL